MNFPCSHSDVNKFDYAADSSVEDKLLIFAIAKSRRLAASAWNLSYLALSLSSLQFHPLFTIRHERKTTRPIDQIAARQVLLSSLFIAQAENCFLS